MEWSFTMDADGHLTIYRGRAIQWEGSYEAFVADGDIQPPVDLVRRIHERAEPKDEDIQQGWQH